MRKRTKYLGMFIIALTAASAGAADVYRWNDPQGNMVISDRPPETGVEYEVVSAQTGRTIIEPPEPATSTRSTAKEPAPEEKKAEQPREVSQFSAPKKDPKLCEQARSNLRILEDGPRIRFTDDEGVVRFMSDDERNIEKDKTRDAIAAYCD